MELSIGPVWDAEWSMYSVGYSVWEGGADSQQDGTEICHDEGWEVGVVVDELCIQDDVACPQWDKVHRKLH